MIDKQYGSWISPITSSIMLSGRLNYTYMCLDQHEATENMNIYYIEMRPMENGRNVIVSKNVADQKSQHLLWTPDGFSARSRVHEYGGSDVFVHNRIVYFTNESDQQLYKQISPMECPIKLSQSVNCRYANGYCYYSCGMSNSTPAVIYIVREDHKDESKGVTNTIVAIRNYKEAVVVQGADFYSSPRVSPSEEYLCWVEWNFPNMPWDNTKVCIGKLDSNSLNIVPGSILTYANCPDVDPVSCILPMWTKNNDLLYINDKTGFWNIWLAKTPEQQINLTPIDEDLGGPMWVLDFRTYNYSRLRDWVTVVRKGGKIDILRIDGTIVKTIELQPYITSMAYPSLMADGSIVVIGGSPDSCTTIYHISIDGSTRILGTDRDIVEIDPRYYSFPKHLSYSVPGGISHGYYYSPCNPDYCGLPDTLPPLLVLAHGGPTSAANLDLNLTIQFYTSRGFAVLDVDYRGSTGYGKEYRNLLKYQWGVLDRIDCCEGANYLVSQHLVDKSRLAISGKSAGGYTTLCCLTFSETFKIGCSTFGVGDLNSLAKDAHKFGSRYLDTLIGDYDQHQQLYYERSPINYPDNIKCAMVFYQGDEDKVVPKEQSEKMYETVKAKGIPCSLVMYKGEQHGFRKAENIAHQIESEYYFYGKIFGFDTPGIVDSIISIENNSQQ